MAEPLLDEAGADPRTVPEKRRAQIVDAAVRLFSERGYFQTTIEDIANAIPVSKGLVYRYFKDKNDLLFYCLRYVLDKYKSEELPDLISELGPLGALRKVLKLHCVLAKEHTLEILLAYKSTKDLTPEQRRQIKVLESRTARMIRQCLDACVHRGLMVPLNTEIMAYQYLMFGHTWALKNWAFRDRHSADEYMAEGEAILIKPFLTPAGVAEFNRTTAALS
jgi:AcrR family transcriptional regulator